MASTTAEQAPVTERPTRAQRKERTRAALLTAARSVVARRGMQAATHEEIASEAGLTIGAIYSNFASKADLMAALMDDVAAQSNLHLEPADSLRDCLDALAHRVIEQVDRDPQAVDLSLEFALFAVRYPEARERRLPHWEDEHRRHEEVLAGVAERSGRPLPGAPRDVAEAVSNLAWSLMCSRRVLGAAVITDEAIVNAMRMLDAG
jgi:AcrR family transcriptional regulator